MPKYPVWSTGCTKPGAGSTGESPKTATNFCPKCGDCTLQTPDHWFWMPNTPIKSLRTLIQMYHGTVGSNSVMELDFAVDRTGNIDPTHAARYQEFGAWIRGCYGVAAADSGAGYSNATIVEITVAGEADSAVIDRVAVMEDLSAGQRITAYKVEVIYAVNEAADDWQPFSWGTSVGHKRIDVLSKPSGKAISKLRLTVTDSVAPPMIRLSAYKPCLSA